MKILKAINKRQLFSKYVMNLKKKPLQVISGLNPAQDTVIPSSKPPNPEAASSG